MEESQYERIGSWYVNLDIPEHVRSKIREDIDSVNAGELPLSFYFVTMGREDTIRSLDGTFVIGDGNRYHPDRSMFGSEILIPGASPEILMPDPFVRMSSYFGGEYTDDYDKDSEFAREKISGLTSKLREMEKNENVDKLILGSLRKQLQMNGSPMLDDFKIALKDREVSDDPEKDSEYKRAWLNNPETHYTVRLVIDYENRDARIEPVEWTGS